MLLYQIQRNDWTFGQKTSSRRFWLWKWYQKKVICLFCAIRKWNKYSRLLHIQKKLPKSYNVIPTTLLGRLAIDKKYQGQGLGKILLIDALKRCFEIAQEIGSFAVIVDPKDKEAEKFVEKYDVIRLPDSKKMFLAIKTLQELFG